MKVIQTVMTRERTRAYTWEGVTMDDLFSFFRIVENGYKRVKGTKKFVRQTENSVEFLLIVES
jgi:hypothetical protein